MEVTAVTFNIPIQYDKDNHIIWTTEMRRMVVDLFNSGEHTMLEIAAVFGTTRSAISGIIARTRKSGDFDVKAKIGEPTVVAPPPLIRETSRTPVFKMKLSKTVLEKPKRCRLRVITDFKEVEFHDLREHHCRYPIGDPRDPDFRFCGRMRNGKEPYCLEHAQICCAANERR